MNWLAFLLSGVLVYFQLTGQNPIANKYAATISSQDLKQHLYTLAADSMMGRQTGESGQKLAAKYIESQFQTFGLDPILPDSGYQQSYKLYKQYKGGATLERNGQRWTDDQDFIFLGNISIQPSKSLQIQVYEQLADIPAPDGETIPVLLLKDRNFMGPARKLEELGYQISMVIPDIDSANFSTWLKRFNFMWNQPNYTFEKPEEKSTETGVVVLPVDRMVEILGIDPGKVTFKGKKRVFKGDKVTFHNQGLITEEITGENVIGRITGTGKPDEYIMITAHYDHVGTEGNKIYNGADDDASGTSAILEIGQAFAQMAATGHAPKRSIVVMAVSGEEIGLMGSEYYVNHPVLPLADMMANLNIDMVGRVDEKHADSDPYLYVIGSDKISDDLHELSERVNATYTQLDFDYTYNNDKDPNRFYYRSDHYNFAKNGIPVIFYFNGTHADYHKETDTADKINYDLLEVRTQLIYYTAFELANKETGILTAYPDQ